jgi:tripartite-type tricarboxylate transporter receptor subunit TctC
MAHEMQVRRMPLLLLCCAVREGAIMPRRGVVRAQPLGVRTHLQRAADGIESRFRRGGAFAERGYRMNLRRRIALMLFAATWPVAFAQTRDYPDKPIRVVVTFPPGGSSDAVLRLIAPRLSERLGQQIVIDNKPGAGGNIGLALVAKATPDGYTIGLGAAGALAANASLYAQMPFDPEKDLAPVAMLAAIPFVIVGSPTLTPRTQPDLVAYAKANPTKLSIGHGGNGTAMHLATALFKQMSAVPVVEVPYKGSGPAALDVMSGQIPLALVDLSSSLQHVKAGKLIAYAVTSPKRLPTLPDVPTVAEAGLQGYDATGWFGIVAPAGTPAPVLTRLHSEINAALSDATIAANIRNLGAEPVVESREWFGTYIRAESQKWKQVIRAANIKVE